jgi:hypothetical protein
MLQADDAGIKADTRNESVPRADRVEVPWRPQREHLVPSAIPRNSAWWAHAQVPGERSKLAERIRGT